MTYPDPNRVTVWILSPNTGRCWGWDPAAGQAWWWLPDGMLGPAAVQTEAQLLARPARRDGRRYMIIPPPWFVHAPELRVEEGL